MRPVDESEWEEVDISTMEKDEDGEVEIDGLGYISDAKPKSENLRLEPGTIKAWGAPPAPDCQPQLPHH